MVLLHLKQSEERQFLYQCSTSASVDEVVKEVVRIHNMQLRLLHLKEEGDSLALHGPAKDPDCEDDDSDDEAMAAETSQKNYHNSKGPFYNKDPASRRTGEACDPEVAQVLTKALAEAAACVSKEQVLHKVTLDLAILKEAVLNVKGAVMICYPMGLPRYDPVQQELNGTFENKEAFDPNTAQMWWAGKEFVREKKISDHLGKNEKTKVIVKLQAKGLHAPAREPPVDEKTQKAMMSWYHKQQQEQEKLKDNEDDSYLASTWANPKALKCHFNNTDCIQFR